VVANRFGAIADLGLLLHSLKNQGICVDEWEYLDEFMKLNNGGEREWVVKVSRWKNVPFYSGWRKCSRWRERWAFSGPEGPSGSGRTTPTSRNGPIGD
jgi:hypothetical protein